MGTTNQRRGGLLQLTIKLEPTLRVRILSENRLENCFNVEALPRRRIKIPTATAATRAATLHSISRGRRRLAEPEGGALTVTDIAIVWNSDTLVAFTVTM